MLQTILSIVLLYLVVGVVFFILTAYQSRLIAGKKAWARINEGQRELRMLGGNTLTVAIIMCSLVGIAWPYILVSRIWEIFSGDW